MIQHFDYDLWARLIAGMGAVETGHVLKVDFLSYTPVHTWFDHEWGSGVIFYIMLKYFGSYSLIILQAVLFFLIFFVISRIVKRRSENYAYNILVYFFAIMILLCNINTPVRSHMFSFLLYTVFMYLLERVRGGQNKLLYLIPFIIILWNNLHGGVVSGIGLIAMYALGEFLNKKPFKQYLITLGFSCAALFINPWGYDYIKFLIMANTMQRPVILEWLGLFSQYYLFKKIAIKIFMLAVILIEFITGIKKYYKTGGLKEWYNNADKVKYIVLLVTLYLGIVHVKLLPFFIISSLCFVYDDFYNLINKFKFPAWKDKVIYTTLIAVSLLNFVIKDISLPVGFGIFPVKEVEFVRINKLGGNILTSFNVGSYVSYKLYPHNKIYMDGRYEEVYPEFILSLLKEFTLLYPLWYIMLQYFPPDVIIFEKNAPVYNALKNGFGWELVYEGSDFGVFLPKEKANQKFKQPSDDTNYYKNTLFNTDVNFKL